MSPPPRSTPERAAETAPAPVLWTLLVGMALIGLAAAPKRAGRGGDAVEPGLDPERELRSDPGRNRGGVEGAKSYTGRAALRIARTQRGRGRAANRPTQIPAPGWWDVAVRVYLEFNKDSVLSVAGGVTFFTLLSLFPAVAALVSCYGLFADVGVINEHLAAMQGVLPSGAIDIVGEQVKRIAAKGSSTLSLTFFTSLAISLWSANAAMKAMFEALNIVYEEDEKRSFVWLNLTSLAFTAGALIFVILALTAIVVLPVVFNLVGIGGGAWLVALLRWPALVIVLLGGLSLLYRYGPSREPPRWRWVTWGSGIAAVLWLGASLLFSWYVANFGSYNETYGSLGAAIGFMTWIWISSIIVLLGGEINAEMEHQTARDTTTGPALPMGARQARMADSLGAAA